LDGLWSEYVVNKIEKHWQYEKASQILSLNLFRVRKVHQRVKEPHVKFHERQELITLRYTVSFVRF